MLSILKPAAAVAGLVLTGASSANCIGSVIIGEGNSAIATSVANKAVGNTCLNDLIIDTEAEGANYGNHGEFVTRLSKQVTEWVRQNIISPKEDAELRAAVARSTVGKTLKVRIIAFNDFHGNIDGANLNFTSPPDDIPARTPAGGVDYMAGLVRQLKAGAPNNVVVSAGDLIGASPLNSALFHDEPTIETMNRLGLEFNAVGNHEFDEGRDELLRMQHGGCHPTDANSCQGASVGTPYPFEGARFEFLAANVVDTASGKTLFPAYGVKNFNGNRVAFIGMTLESTPTIVTPTGIAGLAFKDEADTTNQLIGVLRQRGINAVVVLIHEGGVARGSINGCDGVTALSSISSSG